MNNKFFWLTLIESDPNSNFFFICLISNSMEYSKIGIFYDFLFSFSFQSNSASNPFTEILSGWRIAVCHLLQITDWGVNVSITKKNDKVT
jgi:hypothetical protein